MAQTNRSGAPLSVVQRGPRRTLRWHQSLASPSLHWSFLFWGWRFSRLKQKEKRPATKALNNSLPSCCMHGALKISSRMIHWCLWKLSDSTLFQCLTEATYNLCHFLQWLSSKQRLMQLELFAEIVNHPCSWLWVWSCPAYELFMWLSNVAFTNRYYFIGC